MKKFILLAALTLGACQATPSTPSSASQVYAAKNTYEAALILAVQYNSLPRCGAATSPPLCSDTNALAVIRRANTAARTALDGAEKTVRDPSLTADAKSGAVVIATNAVAVLQGVITLYYSPKGA